MQIDGSSPLQFLNNPQPGPAVDAGQDRQAAGNGVQNTAINPPTAVNPVAQTQTAAPASSASQTRQTTAAAPATTQPRASTSNQEAAPSNNGQDASPRLDVFA